MHRTDTRHQELILKHIDNTPLAVAQWDKDYIILSWSKQAERIFGWKQEEVIGRRFTDFPFIFEEDLPSVLKLIERFTEGSIDSFTSTNRNYAKDGRYIYCTWYSSAIKDSDGEIISILSFVQDVTESVIKEKELQGAKERFEFISAATNDGIWEWNVQENTVWANETFCTTFGYDPQQFSDYYDEWLKRIHPDDKDRFLNSIYSAQKRGDQQWSGEFRFLLADDTYGVILQRVLIIYDDVKNVQKIVGTDLNITALRKAESALLDSERKFKKIFELNPIAISITLKKNTTIYDANKAFCNMLGFQRQDVIGHSLMDIGSIAPHDFAELRRQFEAHNSIRDFQLELKTSSGKPITCLFYAEMIEINQEQFCINIVYDITEIKTTQDKLHKSYGEIRSLASHLQQVREKERAMVAREIHDELGQILTGLKMDISWLKKIDKFSPEQVKARIENITLLLDNSINTVRNISAELRPHMLEDLGLVEALHWQCNQFEKRTGISVSFNYDREEINTSEEKATAFYRIAQEALTNIARHASADQVWVSLIIQHGHMMLSIKDNGKGFSLENKNSTGALGILGMKERMFAIDGTFAVESTPNQGTTIKVSCLEK